MPRQEQICSKSCIPTYANATNLYMCWLALKILLPYYGMVISIKLIIAYFSIDKYNSKKDKQLSSVINEMLITTKIDFVCGHRHKIRGRLKFNII